MPPPPPPPAAASTSYRPIEKPGWGRTAALAAGVIVLATGGFTLWRSLQPPVAPPAPEAGTETSAAPAQEPVSDFGAADTGGVAGLAGAVESRPTGPAASPVRPATPPVSVVLRPSPSQGAPAGSDSPSRSAPASADTRDTPVVTATVHPPEATAPAPPPAEQEEPAPLEALPPSGLPPLQELRRLATGLVDSTENLTEVYQTFLDQKDDQGEELTASDTSLRDELEALNEAAVSFDATLNKGVFARARNRFRRPNEMAVRAENLRRAQEVEAKVNRVDQLMAAVRPSAEVRQAWSTTRAQWKRARQLVQP